MKFQSIWKQRHVLYKFLIQQADRADLVEGERDASEREVMDE